MIFGRKRKMTRSIRKFVGRMREYEAEELRKPYGERNIFCDGTDAHKIKETLDSQLAQRQLDYRTIIRFDQCE